MKVSDAVEFAKDALVEFGLDGWKVALTQSKRTFGQCQYGYLDGPGTIKLSEPLVSLNDEADVLDTILHEIAHALAPRGAGHGWQWKRKAVEVGAKPVRCYDSKKLQTPPPNWIGYCAKCGVRIERYRLKESMRHSAVHTACGKDGTISWERAA